MEIIVIVGILILIGSCIAFLHYRHLRSIALSRSDSDICRYARSFDYRHVDTKIMREVYNHVQEWAGRYEGIPFPVEADDCFDEIYKMDSDDLDDIYLDIAQKLGISTENPEANPYWNKVSTVKNLVLFLHNQPKIKAQ
jgi:acyl carrier protein